jgi:hypothetical protein
MLSRSEKKSLSIVLSVFFFVVISTWGITLLARGYRPSLQPGGLTLNPTGLLSATSRPKGASVYINNSLITATDDTINLTPGDYVIKIIKDGYFNWQKTIKIKAEIVYQTDAQLFRSTPDLKPITHTGVINPSISPDYSRIIYAVASSSATANNGLYLIELSANPLYLTKNTPHQIATNTTSIDWSKASFEFSPNSLEVIATFKNNSKYLLPLTTTIDTKSLSDITPRLAQIKQLWDTQNREIVTAKVDRLPLELHALVSTVSAQNIAFTTTEDKVLYQATASATIPQILQTPPPAQSTQTQSRTLTAGDYYIYDIKEDTNYRLGSPSDIHYPFWLPNSSNIVYLTNQELKASDYDSTNQVTVYGGNFNPKVTLPWFDGNKIITLTAPFTGAIENLYTITIR